MPRTARIIIPGEAHHVTQRGNNKQIVFKEDNDFSNYCYWVNKYGQQYNVSILAYCLMSNHVHFIVVPQDKQGISKMFSVVHMRYARYINYHEKASGHVWQGRFFSCVLDDSHLYFAIRYVEQNPVRAGMSQYPWDYPWSSARWHVKKPVKNFIKVKDTALVDQKCWKDYILNKDDQMDEKIRQRTLKGKAAAGEAQLILWEKKFKCGLRGSKSEK